MPSKRRTSVIAHHLIWTLYGHWLANDLRGSGSTELRDPKFESLGPIYHGRKPEQLQPTREELKAFHKKAEPLLQFPRFWINEAKRQAITDAFAEVIAERDYTVWACAILANHAHMVIRRHRDDALAMWHKLADASRKALQDFADIESEHPIWGARPYKVFLRSPDEVKGRVAYVERNPEKEGLPRQQFTFVKLYDGWPFHNSATHSSPPK